MASGEKRRLVCSNVAISGIAIGANAYRLLNDILTPEKSKDKTYAELREALLSH